MCLASYVVEERQLTYPNLNNEKCDDTLKSLKIDSPLTEGN